MENQKPNNEGQACPTCTQAQGQLPSCAPLANPYVPFQINASEPYKASRGLIRGTLFPGLDLPFMGMVNNQEMTDTPMHELQALGFAMQELGLYLDAHKDDKDALALFRSYADLYQAGMAEYQKSYGPLVQSDAGKDGVYNWTQNPWPWDGAAESEE